MSVSEPVSISDERSHPGGVPLPREEGVPDEELIRQCRAGRPAAFGTLVERHQDRLYAALLKMFGSADAAREAVQDAFVLAYQKLDGFGGRSQFSTWLYRIAVNAALSRKRRQKRQPAPLDGFGGREGVEPTDHHPAADPARPMELAETQDLVRRALAGLSEEFRTVLVLKEIDGFRYEEIAEIVDIPIGTVRSRIHRAREELRGRLKVLLSPER